MKVLGVDPGMYTTGFGLIQTDASNLRSLAYGLIRPAGALKLPLRLKEIYESLQDLIARENPDVVVIEDIFFGKNFKVALRIGEVRSLVMLAAANHNVKVVEYPPARIKEAVVGYGRAAKVQVQEMVKRLLSLDQVPEQDAADALACAICHCHSISFGSASRVSVETE